MKPILFRVRAECSADRRRFNQCLSFSKAKQLWSIWIDCDLCA